VAEQPSFAGQLLAAELASQVIPGSRHKPS
jgi:hypothetical protein